MGRYSTRSTGDPSLTTDVSSTHRRRPVSRYFMVLLLLLVGLFWFAPTIVLKTNLGNRLIGRALGNHPGRFEIGDGNSGWFSGTQLRDVTIWDTDGKPLARVPLIEIDRTLIELFTSPSRLGRVRINNPEVQIVLWDDGSNLENLLSPWLTTNEESPVESEESPLSLTLQVVGGRFLVTDTTNSQSCTVDNLNLDLRLPEDRPQPLVLGLTADASQNARQGHLALDLHWQIPNELGESDLGAGTIRLAAERFPLAAMQPILRRADSDLSIQGQLDADAEINWKRGPAGPDIDGQGTVSLQQPRFTMPSVLGPDVVDSDHLTASIDMSTQDQSLLLQLAEIHSDIASLRVSGTVGITELLSCHDVSSFLLNWESSHQFTVNGDVNLARLAGALPETLRIRSDTEFTQGHIRLNAESRMELGHRLLKGSIQTDRLEAVTAGRRVTWDQPLHVAIGGYSSADGVRIQQLKCQSDFLKVTAAGTLEQGKLEAHGDLAELFAQLRRFSDPGQIDLAGSLAVSANWNLIDSGLCDAHLSASIANLAYSASGSQSFREQELRCGISARARVGTGQVQRLESLQWQLASGDDNMSLALVNPVDQPGLNSNWTIACQLTGHAESWLARIRPWMPLEGMALQANVDASFTGNLHDQQVILDPIQIELSNTNFQSAGILIREPTIRVGGDLAYASAENRIRATELTMTSAAIAARAQRVEVALSPDQPSATGLVAFRGDLGRLWDWQYSPEPPPMRMQGEVVGQTRLGTANGSITFEGNADVNQFTLQQREVTTTAPTATGPWSVLWSEPTLKIKASGGYQLSNDHLLLTLVEATGNAVSVNANGSVGELSTAMHTDVKGQATYDLARMAERLRETLGPDVQLAGQRQTTFAIQGPLQTEELTVTTESPVRSSLAGELATSPPPSSRENVPESLTAQTTLGWDSIHAYGITMGPQDISTQLRGGVLLFSPVQTTLASGNLSLTPRIELNADPMVLVIDEGLVADNLQITPEMFSQWFKYVAPILAGAATAEGRMSIQLAGASVPLDQPMRSSVSGAIQIDGARVQPGPMAQQILGTVTEVATLIKQSTPDLGFLSAGQNWLELPPQKLEFQMQQGRVYHRNLEVRTGNMVFRTRGWVGLDQSVGLIAEIPIQDGWVTKNRFLSNMQGQSIQIPIQGTMTRPRLERGAIAGLSRQLLGNTARQLLQGEIQKGLQKLLGPK